jgi:hypothetical protein
MKTLRALFTAALLIAGPAYLLHVHLQARSERLASEESALDYRSKALTTIETLKATIVSLNAILTDSEVEQVEKSQQLAKLAAQNGYRSSELERMREKQLAEIEIYRARETVWLTRFEDFVKRHEDLVAQYKGVIKSQDVSELEEVKKAIVSREETERVKLEVYVRGLEAQLASMQLKLAEKEVQEETRLTAQEANALLSSQTRTSPSPDSIQTSEGEAR